MCWGRRQLHPKTKIIVFFFNLSPAHQTHLQLPIIEYRISIYRYITFISHTLIVMINV